MAAQPKAAAKRRIGIVDLLRWAYCQELPKVPRIDAPASFRSAWDKVSEWAEELSLAGLDENRFGVVPDLLAQDYPHADAVLVHEAVCDLDRLEVEGLADYAPVSGGGDVAGALLDACNARVRAGLFTRGNDGRPRLRKPLRNLIFHAAILGRAPDWEISDFAVDFERWPNGAVKYFKTVGQWEPSLTGDVWREWEQPVTPRPGFHHDADAHPVAVLVPDPYDDGVSRAHYELWRLSLDVLAADLSGRLEKWDVQPSDLPPRPWDGGERRAGRVLPALSQDALDSLRLIWGENKSSSAA
jgi:hypothetical protein